MDLSAVSEWLKTTVPGIIILGAIGSIVAVPMLWAAKRLLFPSLVTVLVHSVAKVAGHFAKPAAAQIASFIIKNGNEKLPLFYTLQVMKLVIALFLATCTFVLFALAAIHPTEPLARGAVLVPLVISFLLLWYALRCLAVVMLPVYINIEGQIEDAKRQVLARQGKNAR
jgi:hypothetical protein